MTMALPLIHTLILTLILSLVADLKCTGLECGGGGWQYHPGTLILNLTLTQYHPGTLTLAMTLAMMLVTPSRHDHAQG